MPKAGILCNCFQYFEYGVQNDVSEEVLYEITGNWWCGGGNEGCCEV